MRTLNLGILAHVDAGKTSLTERLLHTAGVIDEIGSVDAGSTVTDTLALERRRGITIKSAVVSFPLGGVTVNLIDTPGHPDFIAEVERVLGVLDGAVLVISAVEGVQAQTRVLMRTLRRLRIPTLLFVNKVDRRGARCGGLLRGIAERLTPDAVAMTGVGALGTRDAVVTPFTAADTAFTARLTELLAERDDAVLAAYLADEPLPHRRLMRGLARRTRQALAHPVYFGSAATGAGLDALTAGLTTWLPATRRDPAGPLSGTVFKVDRGPAGERLAYVSLTAGTVRVRDRLRYGDPAREDKVTGIEVFDDGAARRRDALPAGRIGVLRGPDGLRIGDAVGLPPAGAAGRQFAPPTLETVVEPARPSERGALHTALGRLAEQDPLIGLRFDGRRGEISLSLYGEVQKEVVRDTLSDESGLGVTFRATTPICVERPAGGGAAQEAIGQDGNPFLATVGLRVEPAPEGAGVTFELEVEPGAMPSAFFAAVEDTVRETLEQGLHGWRVTDCRVSMTRSGYCPRQSHAHARFDKSMSSTGADFRGLTPLVLMAALRRAGTVVHEPVHRFRLDLPADTLGPVLPVLAALRAVPGTPRVRGAECVLEGAVPAAAVHELERRLPGLTRGEGVVESAFDRYAPLSAAVRPPSRPRTDHNPLHREEYLLRVLRRSGPGGGTA